MMKVFGSKQLTMVWLFSFFLFFCLSLLFLLYFLLLFFGYAQLLVWSWLV